MSKSKSSIFEYGRAICYSGYREGQSPVEETYPSYEQVSEDLAILSGSWKYLRLYDSGPNSETTLEVIEKQGLDFKVMLGASLDAEVNNVKCPWGGIYPRGVLAENRKRNEAEIQRMIQLASRFPEIVFSLSIGNETTADWTDHMVPVNRLIEIAKIARSAANQPVTFCEGYKPWLENLQELAGVLDFISIHTYPIWEHESIENALACSIGNFSEVDKLYSNKPVIITEAGWTTKSNGKSICESQATEAYQGSYCSELLRWSEEAGLLNFIFEAFDEPWKGSPDPSEPEKHWGLYTVDRSPKAVVKQLQNLRCIEDMG